MHKMNLYIYFAPRGTNKVQLSPDKIMLVQLLHFILNNSANECIIIVQGEKIAYDNQRY